MSVAAHLTSPAFKENAKEALADPQLQSALHGIETGIVDRRRAVVARLPEFEALRDSARDIKNHTLAHLDLYLEQFEQRCTAAGGNVHYAVTGEEARATVLEICRRADARLVTKKAGHIAATGAGTLLAGDMGCLMNMAGKLQRLGKPVKARHVAEVLAGIDTPAIGER